MHVTNCFIGHNFGDYKNFSTSQDSHTFVLSVTILETTKTLFLFPQTFYEFYRSQFWRLQKQTNYESLKIGGFIGHNFGDYKNSTRLV